MKPSKAIKYKALFLLVSFSLNSVVGCACTLGVDMGFNLVDHAHNDGGQHQHFKKDQIEQHLKNQPGKQPQKHSYNHNHSKVREHSASNTIALSEPENNNCCNDLVVFFQTLDKALVKVRSSVQKRDVVFSTFVIPLVLGFNNIRGFTNHYRIFPKEIDLPPPDILTIIQSFRI